VKYKLTSSMTTASNSMSGGSSWRSSPPAETSVAATMSARRMTACRCSFFCRWMSSPARRICGGSVPSVPSQSSVISSVEA